MRILSSETKKSGVCLSVTQLCQFGKKTGPRIPSFPPAGSSPRRAARWPGGRHGWDRGGEQGRACQLVARPRIGRAEGARAFRPLGCVAANATQRTPRGARVATLVPSAHRGNPSPRRRRRPALGVPFLRRCAAGGTCSRPPEAAKQKRSPARAPGERPVLKVGRRIVF